MSTESGIELSVRRLRAALAGSAVAWLFVAGGCGDDAAGAITLSVTDPEPDAVLDAADDSQPSRAGFQYSIVAQGVGLTAGTPVDLYLDGEPQGANGEIDDDGMLTLQDVTLPPGEHTLYVVTSVGSAKSDETQKYTLRTVVISSPADGEVLTGNDDADPNAEGFQTEVVVRGYAIDLDEPVTLLVDGADRDTLELDEQGRGTFTGVTLTPGDHTLRVIASAGDDEVESQEIDVTVSQSCADVSFVSPVAPTAGDVLLGGSRCESDGSATTRVEIETDASDGSSVELLIDGESIADTTVTDSSATFEAVAIPESGVSTLAVRVRSPDGGSCVETFPAGIGVDCEAPSCAFLAPEPVEFEEDGETTLYLGRAQRDDDGFHVQVQAGAEGEGEIITLSVDDGDEQSATSDGDAVASFPALDLEDGSHTFRARCRDAAGNVRVTPELTVIVDTQPCQVSITDPEVDALLLPGDDAVSGMAGTQIVATATVGGGDCIGSRVGLCEDDRLPDGDFDDYDGSSPFLTTVTLDADTNAQNLCFEIADRAGNVGRDAIDFVYRDDAPELAIESPNDGESFNALGNGGHTADADRSAASLVDCDGEVWIACTELGSDVELHRNAATGAVFGTGECEAADDSDADLPDGYAGRAKITAVLSDGDDSSTFVATQTLEGTSASLIGVSEPITVATDCELPQLDVVHDPCNARAPQSSGQITLADAADFDVVIADTSNDIDSATLSFMNDDLTMGMPSATTSTSGMVSWEGLVLGGEGNLAVTVTLTDDFDNVVTNTCLAEIVSELPSITSFTLPTDGQVFGPGDATCSTGDANEFGVRLTATIDQTSNRIASVYVNDVLIDGDLTIGDAIDTCVPVPDDTESDPVGGSGIRLRVDSTVGDHPGNAQQTQTVHVHTLEITDPVADQLIVSADDCDGGAGFGYQVSVDVDPVHSGAAYTLSGGSTAVTGTVAGTTISRCVPFVVGGDRTFTVSIDGTSIAYSVDVVVVDDTPEIASIDAPEDEQLFGPGDGTCDAGNGDFGVLVQATVDQADNRSARVLVNGVVAESDLEIDGQSIETCVAVTDDLENDTPGPTTITLQLDAVLGTGTASASVQISVDTLDITDPVADQLVLSGDDCLAGAGFGYPVHVDVDPSHNGEAYTLSGGLTPVTGTVSAGAISRCVPLAVGGDHAITASLDGTGITESVTVETIDDTPTITAITAPTEDQVFAIDGETCNSPTGYGVLVTATVDQSANREADVSVNGVLVANDVAITGTSISTCVAVPDDLAHSPSGQSTITLTLHAVQGVGADATASVHVSLDALEITDPANAATLLAADDCDDGPGYGYQVVVDVDPSLNGSAYTLEGSAGSVTGTLGGGMIARCVPLDVGGDQTITATLDGTGITESVTVETIDDTPVITGITAPSEDTVFGIGEETCALASGFGVLVTANVDQSANREADILVNDVLVANDVTITGTSISTCVPVPDDLAHAPNGQSTITLRLHAPIGAGPDASASVHVSLDLLDITEPVADQVLLAADDCQAGAAFGGQLEVDVDPSLDGAAYSITGGTSTLTGTVASGAISRCVGLDVGEEQTLTVTLTASGIDESVTISTLDDTPEITAITAPTEDAVYLVGDADCAPGSNGFGVRVNATVDQSANREADISLNGVVVVDNAPIVGTSISECIAVPDDLAHAPNGQSTITLTLHAPVGGGADDTASVHVSLDLLDITAPAQDQTLLAANDCDAGSGYGVTTTVAVDESLNGAAYSITGGTSTLTGNVASGAISRCVGLTVGAQSTITVTLTASGITESVDVETIDDTPATPVITAPTEDQVFGIDGETCNSATGYGVHVTGTVDQSANREADVLVNGVVVANNVTITGNAIDTCVAVPDDLAHTPSGQSTITLSLHAPVGAGPDASASAHVSLDLLDITAPTQDQTLLAANDCDAGSGYGVTTTVAVDPSLNGAAYSITGGTSTLTGNVASGAISRCVGLTVGAQSTITVTLTASGITESVDVETIDDTPATPVITAPTEDQVFGIDGETCNSATGYGVRVTGTVDQSANREADVLVNGVVVANNVTITGNAIDTCVAVPDDLAHTPSGQSTITLSLHAPVGAGPDASASAHVSLDLFDITSPADGVTLTSTDDCDAGTGIGATVAIDVDPSLNGSDYTIDGGGALATGTVSGGAISRCVAVDPGSHPITASIDGTGISEAIDVTIVTDAPSIASITPADDSSFGIGGQTCSTGVANTYGILVGATIDQTNDRELDIFVNDVLVADNVTLSSTTISRCVAVPDDLNHAPSGASTIRVRLNELSGARFDEDETTVNVTTLNITAPAASADLGVAQDCDPSAGYGVTVTASADASNNGRSFAIDAGGTDATGTVSGGSLSACVPAVDGAPRVITVSLGGTTITDTVSADVYTGPPTDAIVIDDLVLDPDDPNYRDGAVTARWTPPTPDTPGQLATYQMRCAHTPVLASDSASTKNTWWTNATAMTLPVGLDPGDAMAAAPFTFRIAEEHHCVVRAFDVASTPQGSAIDHSTNIGKPLRELVLSSGAAGEQLGYEVQPLGDINADGLTDMVAIGSGIAEVYFGSLSGFSGLPDLTFTADTDPSYIQLHANAIGDFNGDGTDDFALIDQHALDTTGRVSIFFGRASWPFAAFPLDVSSSCVADVCLQHESLGAYMGETVAPLGDFDGDDIDDFAIGVALFDQLAGDGQLMVISGGEYEVRECSGIFDCRLSNETCNMDSGLCELSDPDAFWQLELEVPTGNYVAGSNSPPTAVDPSLDLFVITADEGSALQLGAPIAGLGAFDAYPGTDLVVSAIGSGEVYFLSGRGHIVAGPEPLGLDQLGLRDTITDQPDGFAITNGDTDPYFGWSLANVGDFFDPAGAINAGQIDIAVGTSTSDDFFVVPGESEDANDSGFNDAYERRVHGSASSIGVSLASSAHPTLGLVGDLDDDGTPELIAGTRHTDDIVIWYSDVFAAATSANPIPKSSGSSVTFSTDTNDSGPRIVQAVGDVTGDGVPDILVGDPDAVAFDGQVILLY